MGARRSTATGSARWFLHPTNTWEPPLLNREVQVSARIDEPCASIGVRMENVPQGSSAREVEGFCGRYHSIHERTKTRELADIAEKVLKPTRREVEEKGLKLSITEGGKEGRARCLRHALMW